MRVSHTVNATFSCARERAFGVALLGDATRVMSGYGPVPPVSHFTHDESWGQVGSSRIPHTSGNFLAKPGPVGFDQILSRVENEHWSWQMTDLEHTAFFFLNRAMGEYSVDDNGDGTISVTWTYYMYPSRSVLFPLTWLFVRSVWAGVMRRGIRAMQEQAESNVPFVYS